MIPHECRRRPQPRAGQLQRGLRHRHRAEHAFVAIEAYYGWKVDSLALLADAGHNLSDVAGLVLAWGGALAGRLRPDMRHTYGWKRASILAAFINALLLLVAMGSLAWEAVHRLQSPAPIEGDGHDAGHADAHRYSTQRSG